jgi:hypothetical protein
VLRLIQLKYPDLLAHLIPIDTPRELAAKLQRRRLAAEHGLHPSEIGLFYISPCTALVDAIENPLGRRASHLDGAFSIAEVYGSLLRSIKADPRADSNAISVKGLDDVIYVLDRIESGTFSDADFINPYICSDGCFSGPLTVAGRYTAQRYLHQLVRQLGDPPPVKEEKIRALLQTRFFDLDAAIQPRNSQPAQDLRQAVAEQQHKKELCARLPGKDCGACGAPDCDALAADVVRGEAELGHCPFVRIEQLLHERKTSDQKVSS